MAKKEIKLGQKVRDTITGIEGIATSKTEYLNGCVQYELTRRIKKGEVLTAESIQGINVDSQQLEVIETKKKPIKKSNNGGRMRVKYFGKLKK